MGQKESTKDGITTTRRNIILTKKTHSISYEQVKQLNEVLQESTYKIRGGKSEFAEKVRFSVFFWDDIKF